MHPPQGHRKQTFTVIFLHPKASTVLALVCTRHSANVEAGYPVLQLVSSEKRGRKKGADLFSVKLKTSNNRHFIKQITSYALAASAGILGNYD